MSDTDTIQHTYPVIKIPQGAGVVWPVNSEIPEGWTKNRMVGDRNGYCYIMSEMPSESIEIDEVERDEEPTKPEIDPVQLYAHFVRWLDENEEVSEWANDDEAEVIAQRYLDDLNKASGE